MYAPLYPRMPDVVRSVLLSASLEKIACENPQDPELCKSAWTAKIAVDAEIFAHAQRFSKSLSMLEKTAAPGAPVAEAVGQAAKDALPTIGESLKRGLGYGAGIGIPLAGAGALIAHRGRKETEAATDHIRNQVLLTALGLGGIGAGAYGLSQLANKQASDQSGMQKQAALEESEVQELTEKLGSVGMLEDLLDRVDFEKLSTEAQNEYLQTRILNRGYGARLLYEALHG